MCNIERIKAFLLLHLGNIGGTSISSPHWLACPLSTFLCLILALLLLISHISTTNCHPMSDLPCQEVALVPLILDP